MNIRLSVRLLIPRYDVALLGLGKAVSVVGRDTGCPFRLELFHEFHSYYYTAW